MQPFDFALDPCNLYMHRNIINTYSYAHTTLEMPFRHHTYKPYLSLIHQPSQSLTHSFTHSHILYIYTYKSSSNSSLIFSLSLTHTQNTHKRTHIYIYLIGNLIRAGRCHIGVIALLPSSGPVFGLLLRVELRDYERVLHVHKARL